MRREPTPGSSLQGTDRRKSKTHVILLAGGKGSRLADLTNRTCKPAVGFGTDGCIVDYTIANVFNSGFLSLSVLTQYQPEELTSHIGNRWAALFARNGGSVEICDGADYGGFHGTADAVHKWAKLHPHALDEADSIVVLAADHIYQLDLNEFVAFHEQEPSSVTVGALHVPVGEASAFGILECDGDKRASSFLEKPDSAAECPDVPGHTLASLGIYVFEPHHLSHLLDEGSTRHEDLDFGHHILPRETEAGGVRVFALPARTKGGAYWRDVGTVQSYHAAHMELLENGSWLDDDWDMPVAGDRFSERDGRGLSHVALARDAIIASRHLNMTVVARGARIGLDAKLSRTVIMADAQVGSGAVLSGCVVAPGTRIPPYFHIERYRDLIERSAAVHGSGIVLLTDALIAKLLTRRPLMPRRRPDEAGPALPVAARLAAGRSGVRP